MTCRASKAYACVAYRIMEYEKEEPSEEYLDMLMGILMDFYTAQEIEKIYDKNIIIDSYGIIMNETEPLPAKAGRFGVLLKQPKAVSP